MAIVCLLLRLVHNMPHTGASPHIVMCLNALMCLQYVSVVDVALGSYDSLMSFE